MTSIITTIRSNDIAIFEAVQNNNIDTLKILLEDKNVNKDVINAYTFSNGGRILETAVRNKNIDIVNLLFERFPNVHGSTLVDAIYVADTNIEMLKILLKYKNFESSILLYTDRYSHPLSQNPTLICDNGNTELLRFTLDNIAETDNYYVRHCIFTAIEKDNIEVLKIALDHKSVNDTIINYEKPLKGINYVNSSLNVGPTPLDVATERGNKEIIELLLTKNAKTSIHTKNLISEVNRLRDEVSKLTDEFNKRKQNSYQLQIPELSQHEMRLDIEYSFECNCDQLESMIKQLKAENDKLRQENDLLKNKLNEISAVVSA